MPKAVYPGSFDPVTKGHLDLIMRASRIFEQVIVGVLENKAKMPLFSAEERVKMLEEVLSDCDNVRVLSFEGLLTDFVHMVGADTVLRGLRGVSDFDYESQMAAVNQDLGSVETIFMMAEPEYSYISSSAVRELASYGKDVSRYVPCTVSDKIQEKIKKIQEKECVHYEQPH